VFLWQLIVDLTINCNSHLILIARKRLRIAIMNCQFFLIYNQFPIQCFGGMVPPSSSARRLSSYALYPSSSFLPSTLLPLQLLLCDTLVMVTPSLTFVPTSAIWSTRGLLPPTTSRCFSLGSGHRRRAIAPPLRAW
jgi:hypothetical protein